MTSKIKCSVNQCMASVTRRNMSGLCPQHKKAAFRALVEDKIKDCDTCGEELHYYVKGNRCGACRSKVAKANRKFCNACQKPLMNENTTGLCITHYRPTPPPPKPKPFTLDQLVQAAARVTYSKIEDINGPHRWKWLVRIRQAISHIAFPHYSYSAIGWAMGNRDHSTIIYSCDRAAYMIEKDKLFAQLVKTIERETLVIVAKEERIAA